MLGDLLFFIWCLVQLFIGYNLVLPFLFFLWYSVIKKKNWRRTEFQQPDYAIIVTAYEQTHLLYAVTNSILQSTYKNYLIYVVADKCDVSNLHFTDDRIVLLRPPETLGSNTRSHFYAINHFQRAHTHLTIIDSDNIVERNYLEELNRYFDNGFKAVQGIRKPKNLNTTLACLDAARDIYYHYYDAEVLFNLGSSATLSGSGMAFTVQLYRECLENNDVSGAGFDKVLQYAIVQRNLRIAYAPNAVVYDEKTAASDQLVNQRARWINTWFKYSFLGWGLLAKGIGKASRNQFLFGIVLLRPPLFIFLILSGLFFLVNIVLLNVFALWWLVAFALFITSFFIALSASHADKRIYDSLRNIPKFMWLQVQSLLKAKGANKRSVATKHTGDNSKTAANEN